MSDEIRTRIAVLQHRRRQRAAKELLAEASAAVGEVRHEPIDPELSLQLQTAAYAAVVRMRAHGQLRRAMFPDAEGAVAAAVEQLDRLGTEAVFEAHLGANATGFFAGPLSADFLRACLQRGHESFAAVVPTLVAGVLLDVVIDDPRDGNFFEVEWW